ILAARGWRVSRHTARVTGVPARERAHERSRLRDSLARGRWMNGRGRGAGRSRTAERRRRAARCPIHLEARNALVARVGLLGMLAQDRFWVAAVAGARAAVGSQTAAPGAPPSGGEAARTAATRPIVAIRVCMARPLRPR